MFLPLCRKRTRRVDVAADAAAAAALGQDSFLLRKLLTAAAVESLLGTPPPHYSPLCPFYLTRTELQKKVQPNAVRGARSAQDRAKIGPRSLHLLFKSFASSRHN